MSAARNEPVRPAAKRVLIVGGTGSVGRRIGALLAEELGPDLLIAGRNAGRARRAATALGHGVEGRALDVAEPDGFAAALEDVGMVVVCVDTADLKFAHACITRGISYIDITATYAVIERLGFLGDLACAHGATVISSVGLAPGLTNLMAKACRDTSDVWRLDVHLLFGLGDRHGKAALEWMVDRLSRPFDVATPHGTRTARPFADESTAYFPSPYGRRSTYRFDFSDQHTLPTTLDVDSVSTWTTYDRAGVARMMSVLARVGLFRWTRNRLVRRLVANALRVLRAGSDRFAVSVEGLVVAKEPVSVRVTATGRQEAHGTAVMTAETVRRVRATAPPAGVYQLDELYALDDFEDALAANAISIERHSPGPSGAERQVPPAASSDTVNAGGARR